MIDAMTIKRQNHEAAMPDKHRPRAPADQTSEQMQKRQAMRKRDNVIFERRYRDDYEDPFFPA